MAAKLRVLLVDDEESFTSIVKLNLEMSGNYEVCVENTSANVITTANDFRPDVIVLDIVMPGMDGGDVKRRLASIPALAKVPVLFLTALVPPPDPPDEVVVKTPDGPMLGKPVKTEVLIDCIERCLAGTL